MIANATDSQAAAMSIDRDEARAEFVLASDALGYHRVAWRVREERQTPHAGLIARVRTYLCHYRDYEADEFDAALVATRDRPRLPYGWTALDMATRRLETRPVTLTDPELEASRYAKGVFGLALHLQAIQGDGPILLPVEQVREILKAKKIVVAGTITRLVDRGLLEMTKSEYHTGSAREFRFKGVEGEDYRLDDRPPHDDGSE